MLDSSNETSESPDDLPCISTNSYKERRRAVKNPQRHVEDLPFEIRFLRTAERLNEIIESRYQAYAQHHSDNIENILGKDEIAQKDKQATSFLLYALDKKSKRIVGSLRVTTNTNRPLQIEQEIELPAPFAGRHLATFGRLAVLKGPNSSRIKFALFKSAYLYCLANQINHCFLATVAPIDKIYRRIGFKLVFPESLNFRLHEAGVNLQLYGTTSEEIRLFLKANSPLLYKFIFEDFHPDILIFQPVSSQWQMFRATDKARDLPLR